LYRRSIHDEAPEEIWNDIIHNYPEWRKWVALNKTVPISILDELSHDPDVDVRLTVAMKRKIPPSIFRRLAQDLDESVRERVVYNAKTPPSVLEEMIDDPIDRIAEKARERLGNVGL
jgi:uncharacterized protein (UPF0147 family)